MPTQIIDQNPIGSVFVYHTCNGINSDDCIHVMHFEDHNDGYIMDLSLAQAQCLITALHKAVTESVTVIANTEIM